MDGEGSESYNGETGLTRARIQQRAAIIGAIMIWISQKPGAQPFKDAAPSK